MTTTDRYEAPAYLARYQQRRAAAAAADPAEPAAAAEPEPGPDAAPGIPLYLRRFRERTAGTPHSRAGPAAAEAPEIGLPDLVTAGGQTFTPALAEVTRGKEIAAPLERRAGEQIVAE